jgi:HAE1 family hydrophobic/amphiphilic exporter-1
MTLSTALGLIFIPVTFAVVEYLSHRFVRGGKGVTMDCTHEPIHNPTARKLPTAAAQTEGGQG